MTTPYRNEIDALRERKTSLEGEITKLRAQTTGLEELRAREAELAKELAAVDGRLAAGAAARRPLPLLDQVRVASPCKADWNEMLGDERVRFCLGCEKSVYNLSSMAKDDAEALLRERLGSEVCIRFYERADGTILTQDCPVGVSKKRRRKLVLAVAGAGAMAAAAATMFMKTTCTSRPVAGAAMYVDPAPTMGEPTAEPPVTPIPEKVTPPDREMRMGMAVMTPPPPKAVHPEPKKKPPVMGLR